jgi:hypothetical protein
MYELLLRSKPEVVAAAGAAGVTTITLAPPAGECWIIGSAYGWHDDGAAGRDCSWTITDGVRTINSSTVAAMLQYLRWSLYAWIPDVSKDLMGSTLPLVLHHGCVVTFTVAAIGGTKIAHIDAIVYKFKGVSEFLP